MLWKFLEQQKQTHITLLFKIHIMQNKNQNSYQWPLMTYGSQPPITGPHLLTARKQYSILWCLKALKVSSSRLPELQSQVYHLTVM